MGGKTQYTYTGAGIYDYGGVGHCRNDVWSSTDGGTWTLATAAAPWSARFGHTSVVFNARLWVLGGQGPGYPAPYSDVWSSADGVNWTLETAAAPWGARCWHTSVVFNNRIWVICGMTTQGSTYLGEVWSSPDGVNWTLETASPPWYSTYLHTSVVYNNRIWIIGGGQSFGSSQVWSSADGVNWTLEIWSAPWADRLMHSCVVYEGRIWMFGGTTYTSLTLPPIFFSDVWTSSDGINWTQETAAAQWTARRGHRAAVFNNRIYLGGGADTLYFCRNDVWYYEVPSATITSQPVITAIAGTPYSYTITANGIPTPVIGAGGLPGWLSLGGATLSGTPGVGDIGLSSPITVTATNSGGVDTQIFQIDVQGQPPQITSTPVATATVGVAYTYAVAASGLPAPTLSAGALPGWMTFNAATGELSGTPAPGDTGVSAPIIFTAANSWQPDAVQSFQITVDGVPPQITSAPPAPSVIVGQPWQYTVAATGHPAPNIVVGGNPGWMTLSGDLLSGTPAGGDAGTTPLITVTATNGWLPAATQSFTINVIGVSPSFTSAPPLTAEPGGTYLYTATATGTPNPGLLVGPLPAWLSFDPVTGELTGTPPNTAAGTIAGVTLIATNGVGPDATQSFVVEVARLPGGKVRDPEGPGCSPGGGRPAPFVMLMALLAALHTVRCRHRY
jgi:hypothetical protein